ncbi:Putative effector of murein hydrolase LrgA, UPF0299 family [Rhizobiales bacterium GAS191]|jgi:holin-like protein|nr:Putative effector of murein hydrolase LrgA, UPF0299 family [Rhizobiales bacterium GAS113]SED67492.1 Putative effector of murein hydrolase LrgA, UPF0299 family [Rhizobiales bacterium GAS191]SEE74065.1 Putative effector of murein hydrolase LrgA, UPF0299 family [Rhizobiales bacterium GAS188]
MIVALVLVLLCQLIGEVAARGSGLPVPGPVIGMMLMLALLWSRDRFGARDGIAWLIPRELADGSVERLCKGMLAFLSLLFVPAGVGVMQRLDVLGAQALAIAAAVIVSTLIALAVTAGVFLAIAPRPSADADEGTVP